MKQSITQTLTLTLTIRDGAGCSGASSSRPPRGSGKLEPNLKNEPSKPEPNWAH